MAEALRWLRLTFRSSQSIQAENLFLRRLLALYIERGVKPRRIDPATRIALNLLSQLFDRLHAQEIIACDFFVTVTATFRLLYVFVAIEHLTHCYRAGP